MSDYKIVGKEFNGIKIESFTIEDKNNQQKSVTKADITRLTLNNKMENASVVLDASSSEYVIVLDEGYNNIDIKPHNGIVLTLTARLLDSDSNCIGYKAQDKQGKGYKLSIGKVWNLALQNSVSGVEAKIVNGKKILLSTDKFDIKSLPVLKNKN